MPTHIQDCSTLQNGVQMPWLGFGVFQLEEGEEVSIIKTALSLGYRSIDTASLYHNEHSLGQAIRACGIPREQIFVTSKVWNSDQGFDSTLRAFEQSGEHLGLEYLDLYLIHWPVPDKYEDTWKALEKLYKEGQVRAIGVSNFLIHHLEAILSMCETPPMVNQAEFHPYLLQPELLEFCTRQQIQREASVPLMKSRVLADPALLQIAQRHKKSVAQVILRWDLQHEVVTIPKSGHPERIKQNAQLFDFVLSSEEMTAIDALDRGERVGPHPDDPELYKS